MSWQQAEFKGKTVWARINPDGTLAVEGGRVPIRYQSGEGAKIYRAGASRVTLVSGAPAETLDEGVSADAPSDRGGQTSPARGSSKKRTTAEAEAARKKAEAQIRELEGRAVLVFTDGAARGNPGPAGSGAWLRTPEGQTHEASRSLGRTTNNVAELDAIDLGLDLLDKLKLPARASAAILTDSTYVHGILVRGWKAKVHPERIAALKERLKKRPGTQVLWVPGHVGVEGNEEADRLANRGVERN